MPPTATRGPGRPPAAKAEETRARIVRAAREVFSELGYEAATFQAIAVRADLTRPAINHYFANKRLLYQEVVRQTNDAVVAAGAARAAEEKSLLGRLSAFLAVAMQVDETDRSAAAFLVTSVMEQHRHPGITPDGHDALANSRLFVAWALEDAIKSGEIELSGDFDAAVETLVAMLWGMGFYAGFIGGHADLELVVKQFESLLASQLWKVKR
ncbi:TetR/AcrR family transcriptional regulator [uncultured Mycolicibacterium sp.]|uniref:TetR/AcrR family transcriptional regulator n=1 Tax=uncultured Mycolicibacterium sp. TaxID=2320817 RepID=UPI002628619F|nr:TetR/AcrR family transcriptional regulator [uncultured Mycolicibacterium sp.]